MFSILSDAIVIRELEVKHRGKVLVFANIKFIGTWTYCDLTEK